MKRNKNPYSESGSVNADGEGTLLQNAQHLQETDIHPPEFSRRI